MNVQIQTNIADWINSQKVFLSDIKNPEKVIRRAAFDVLAIVAERIQGFGLLTNGQKIGGGKYSTGAFKSFTTKSGRKAFDFESIATKKQIKARNRNENDTQNFDYGYEEFRKSLGRQVSYIDYTLTGDLFKAWQVLKGPDGNYYAGFTDQENADKKGYLEKMHGVSFELSDKEIELLTKIIQEDVNNLIRRAK